MTHSFSLIDAQPESPRAATADNPMKNLLNILIRLVLDPIPVIGSGRYQAKAESCVNVLTDAGQAPASDCFTE
jgi:hypothetical protein